MQPRVPHRGVCGAHGPDPAQCHARMVPVAGRFAVPAPVDFRLPVAGYSPRRGSRYRDVPVLIRG
jgi:hypothetical protein